MGCEANLSFKKIHSLGDIGQLQSLDVRRLNPAVIWLLRGCSPPLEIAKMAIEVICDAPVRSACSILDRCPIARFS
jgi:hypothetical protein